MNFNLKNVRIKYLPHLFERIDYWNLDINLIEETIKQGKIYLKKCENPNKVCFVKYFGKINTTYFVITILYPNFVEVITAWQKKGN
jgi:hypothetical protein